MFEGNKRLDIYNMYAWMYSLSTLELNVRRVGDKVIVDLLNLVTWGQEALFARWFKETFLPGYEYWYEDLYLSATITPDYADVDLDTGVDYALYAHLSSRIENGTAWAFESIWGDVMPPTKMHPLSEYDPLTYFWPNGTAKKYYVQAPGNSWNGEWMPYYYVPSAWNLREDEQLIFHAPKDLVPGYLDGGNLHYGSSYARNVTEVWGYLNLGYMEPNIVTEDSIPPSFPTSGPGSINYDPATKTLTFTGPLDLYNWSKNTLLGTDDPLQGLAANWKRLSYYTYLNGTTVYTPTLPRGCPYIQFDVSGIPPIDYTSPSIGTPTQEPPADAVMPEQLVLVSANVTDTESGVKNVTLSYTVNNGTSWTNMSMNYNSTSHLYEATIPDQPAGTWVKYGIIAYDNAENQAIKDNAGEYYTYYIIHEFPSAIILPLLLILTMLAVGIVKRRIPRKFKT